MKYCSNCGCQLTDNIVICPNCGSRVNAQPAQDEAATVMFSAAPAPAATAVRAYSPNAPVYAPGAPVRKLKTNRGLVKYILLSMITLGIYGLVVMSAVSTDINTIAGRYDGKKTMHFCLVAFIFSWLTLGIVPLVWSHKISNRIGAELTRRGINYHFSAGTFWGWGVLGSFIVVGPFIYVHKMLKSMNLLAEHYNIYG